MRNLLVAALLALPLLVHAADQTVRGSGLVVKDPSTPDKRKLTGKAKEVGTDNTLVGDPTASGAVLAVRLEGVTPSSEEYALPATTGANGRPFWSGTSVTGFKYKDAKGENGPVKVAQIKVKNGVFQIKV